MLYTVLYTNKLDEYTEVYYVYTMKYILKVFCIASKKIYTVKYNVSGPIWMGPSLPPLTIGQKYKKVMQNKLKWKKCLHFFFDLEPKIEKCLLFQKIRI